MTGLLPVFAESSGDGQTFAEIDATPLVWGITLALILALLLFDLLVVHRGIHEPTFARAAIESTVWISIGLGFTAVLLFWFGGDVAGEYLSGYLIEKSLSIDNVFVWAVIFSYFAVPARYQYNVLFWGIFGALVLRAAFIFAGVALLEAFSWLLFVFGGFLLVTAVRIARHDDNEVDPGKNPILRLVRRVVPSTSEYDEQRLFTRVNGRRLATPLFAVLIMVETTDVVFAVDSIPAILAVSREPYIVFTSNAFAILGLRSLYFLLAGMADKFRYLNLGLAVILAFVGMKMILSEWVHMPTWLSLAVIGVTLAITIAASLLVDRRDHRAAAPLAEAGTEGAVAPVVSMTEKTGARMIVVGVDDSSDSQKALRWALDQAAIDGSQVRAVMAWSFLDQPGDSFHPDYNEEGARAALDAALAAAGVALGDPQIESRLVNGLAGRSLVRESEGADMLVVGSRGMGGIKAQLLGSVSEHCVSHAHCPVVVIPPSWDA